MVLYLGYGYVSKPVDMGRKLGQQKTGKNIVSEESGFLLQHSNSRVRIRHKQHKSCFQISMIALDNINSDIEWSQKTTNTQNIQVHDNFLIIMTVISPWLLSVLCNMVAYQIKIASIIPVLNKKPLPRADCLRHSFKKLFLICYLDWLKEEEPVSLINSNLATEETT